MTPQVSHSGDDHRAETVRAASRWWIWVTLAIAVLAHLPALPFDPLFLARILVHTPAAQPPEDTELILPIDLDLLAEPPRADGDPAATEPPQTPADPASTTEAEPEPAKAPEPSGAAASAEPEPQPDKTEEFYDDLDKPQHGTQTVKDPIAMAGGPGKLGPKAAHVQVLFNGNRLRGNAAGAALGGVLTSLPEWKSFFDGTKIDPITDTEHLLIAGPQFRKSRDVVVWMQYRVSEAEMKDAIDTLVKRTKRGRWIKDAPVPAAVARAHNYGRVFAMIPGKKLLVIMPYSMRKELPKVKSVKPFNNTSKAGIVIALATPQNAFAGYEEVVTVPKTFKWMRMIVTPLATGGADVTLEIGDSSAGDAYKNAPILEKQLSQVRTLAKIATIIGADVLPEMKVDVDHDILRVNATVTQKGLSHILNLARAHFSQKIVEDKGDDDDLYDDEDDKGKSKPSAPKPSVNADNPGKPDASASPGKRKGPRRRKIKLPNGLDGLKPAPSKPPAAPTPSK